MRFNRPAIGHFTNCIENIDLSQYRPGRSLTDGIAKKKRAALNFAIFDRAQEGLSIGTQHKRDGPANTFVIPIPPAYL